MSADGEPTTKARRIPLSTLVKGAACLLFFWHMLATCAQHIPRQSALYPVTPPLAHYQELTGLWQAWDMFTTIPYYHSYSVDVLANEPDGTIERVGVGLPGLRRYDHAVRTETFFTRILYDADFKPYLDAYADKMCAAIRARLGHGGQTIVVHETCERLRWLEQIRLDGIVSNREDHSSQAYTCAN
jgi:hypothetical protein